MNETSASFDTAFARHQAGDIAGAAQLYRAILDREPDHAETLHMLGIIAQQMKNPALALQLMDAALAKNPRMAMAWCNRATVLRVLDRKDEALQSVQKAIAADAGLADAWDMAGSLLREKGRLEESKQHHARAVELQPDNVRFRSNYTVLLLAVGDLADAYKSARLSEKLDKEFVPLPLGNVLQASGYPEKAIPYFRKSYEVLPDFAEAKLNEAMACLQIGDFERGLELWETRPDIKECYKNIPRWNGQKVRHLLLYEDQGVGDALQMLRYIPLIRDRADMITLRLTGYLKALLSENFPDISVITLDDPVPPADARAQLTSLPYLCKTRLETIPAQTPPLHATEAWRAPWRERLAGISGPRIGLVWSGNPENRVNANRSVPFSRLDDLLKSIGPHFVSLQKGQPEDQAKLANYGVFDAAPYLTDFTATAGLLAELDLLVSVCTGPLHLAGVMNRPAWVMLAFDPDWRWLLGREDSPWYPGMRLFRPPAPRDWPSVVRRVTGELQKFIGGDQTVLHPQIWTGRPLRQNPDAIPLDDVHG